MSNADRQKRYRDGKRNAQESETVTRVTPEPDRNAPEPRTRIVPIPGNADYVGCCKQVDGVWQVDNTKPSIKGMSDVELIMRLHYVRDWQRCLEYEEIRRRRAQEAAA